MRSTNVVIYKRNWSAHLKQYTGSLKSVFPVTEISYCGTSSDQAQVTVSYDSLSHFMNNHCTTTVNVASGDFVGYDSNGRVKVITMRDTTDYQYIIHDLLMVPEFVAYWIMECKHNHAVLPDAMDDVSKKTIVPKKVLTWFSKDINNYDRFAEAWVNGFVYLSVEG